ncbi:Hypothetical protein CINCED_3A019695 [Cinara cedri]|uniref:Uncharacterized protein n=1 Tax=Cinara cedri TaxID=506608 RepID=A0A5E4MW28_9HEMI|nr:Hypothetical protein CINCED_3A019695 [Cinara cedri]
MLKILSKTLLILMLLTCSFFVMYNAEARTKLSRKYIPPGNPGGANFNADEEFAESYKLYKKRRELLKKKKLQGKANKNFTRESLAQTLKEKNIVNSYDEHQGACIVDDEGDAMVDQHGINLARLKGAVFIDREEVLRDNNEQNRPKKFSAIQEKKISPVSVTIQDTSFEKMICAHDAINDLKTNNCLSDSTLFDSVIDAAE